MDTPSYHKITVEELADLAKFKTWVRFPTSENNDYWKPLLAANPGLKEKANEARQLIQAIDQYYQQELPDRAAPDPKFASFLSKTVVANQTAQKARISRRKLLRGWSVAASIAFLVGIGLWWTSSTPSNPTWIRHQTNFGEWKKLTLPDGSLVHLNANSELKLTETWEAGKVRQVWLNGEAYFEVAKKEQTKAKFQVITNALTVEVLGTMFNVKSKGTNTKVYLEEGKIKLNTLTESIDLAPNDYIDYTKGAAKLIVEKGVKQQNNTSWKEGTLIMSQQSVKAILERLTEIYGFTYQLDQESLLAEIKTVALPMDQFEVVLPILEKTFDVAIEVKDKNLLIKVK